jgi:plastocyanin
MHRTLSIALLVSCVALAACSSDCGCPSPCAPRSPCASPCAPGYSGGYAMPAPAYGQPSYGQPSYGQPSSGQPPYGPSAGQPSSGQPAQPGYGGAPAARAQGPNMVTVQNHAYMPSTLTVKAGTPVRWKNYDQVAHSATGDGFDVELPPGGEGTHTFTTPGTFDVHCRYHETMRGRVVVE